MPPLSGKKKVRDWWSGLSVTVALVSAAICVALVSENIVDWHTLDTLTRDFARSQCNIVAGQMALELRSLLEARRNELATLGAVWENSPPAGRKSFFVEAAARIVSRTSRYHVIEQVGGRKVVSVSVPPGKEAAGMVFNPQALAWPPGPRLTADLKSRVFSFCQPVAGGRPAIVLCCPLAGPGVNSEKSSPVLLAAALPIEPLIEKCRAAMTRHGLTVGINVAGLELVPAGGPVSVSWFPGRFGGLAARQRLSALGQEWRIVVAPSADGPVGAMFWKNQEHLYIHLASSFAVAALLFLVLVGTVRMRRGREDLRQSEQRFFRLMDHNRDMIYRMSMPEGRYEYVSPGATALTGCAKEEFYDCPRLMERLVAPESLILYKEEWQRLLAGRLKPNFEFQIVDRAGRRRWMYQRQVLIRDQSGRPVATEGFITDISKRKHAEEELRHYRHRLQDLVRERTAELTAVNQRLSDEIEERKRTEAELTWQRNLFEATFNSVPDGMVLTDIGRTIIMVNPALGRIFGYDPEEIIGEPGRVLYDSPEEYDRLGEERYNLNRDGKGDLDPHVVRYRRKSGVSFPGETLGTTIRARNGTVLGFVGVIRDITERLRFEEERQRAQKLESVGLLAGGIAHDFNNLLTAILGNISLAKLYGPSKGKVHEKLVATEKATSRARNLTRQLLTFSKGGAPVKKSASIAELIIDSANFTLSGSNVRCRFSIPPDLWPVEVDEGQISQVIQNLVKNADQVMPDGGFITIAAEHVVVDGNRGLPLPEGRYVAISVADQGCGIPEEQVWKVFDPYFSTKASGTGLGLAVVYSIIKNHNGLITVESEVGVGTVFHLYLPASDRAATVKPAKVERLPGRGRILVMDDEEPVLEVAAEMLAGLGYEVETVEDGERAIAACREARDSGRPFTAVIMDLTVPGGMGGREASARIREFAPEVRAIVSSGFASNPVMAHYKEHGFCGVLPKPYNIEELSRVLHGAVNASSPQHAKITPLSSKFK